MKKLITVLALFIAIYSFSQTNHPDGPYQEFYDTGEVKKEGHYKNNKKTGVFKEYYKSGQLKLTGFYSNGNKIRNWQGYYENGQLRTVNAYGSNGKPTGVGQSYSETGVLTKETKRAANGGLIRKEYYEDGALFAVYALIPSKIRSFVKAGGYKEYYKNGTVKIDAIYSENELNGVWNQFFETGEKEWEVSLVKGYKQGPYKQFYKNGQLKLEGFCELDEKDGEEKQFDSNGNLVNSLIYKNGKLKRANDEKVLTEIDIPDAVIEKLAVYQGCEHLAGNMAKRDCMSKKLSQFVNKKFEKKLVDDLKTGYWFKVKVKFKVDRLGNVIDVKAKAVTPELEKEAIKVVKQLPKMAPGIKRGEPATIPYAFQIRIESRS